MKVADEYRQLTQTCNSSWAGVASCEFLRCHRTVSRRCTFSSQNQGLHGNSTHGWHLLIPQSGSQLHVATSRSWQICQTRCIFVIKLLPQKIAKNLCIYIYNLYNLPSIFWRPFHQGQLLELPQRSPFGVPLPRHVRRGVDGVEMFRDAIWNKGHEHYRRNLRNPEMLEYYGHAMLPCREVSGDLKKIHQGLSFWTHWVV